MRARGFALRDAFADVLRGVISAEEAQDYPTEEAREVEVTIQETTNEQEREEHTKSEGDGERNEG